MRLLCRICGLTLRPGEPHEQDFCTAIALARRVADEGRLTGGEGVVDGDLFEQFRDAWSGLTNATADEMLDGMRLDAGVSAVERVLARRQQPVPENCSIAHCCGHTEEHLLAGPADERERERVQRREQPCFFCANREEYDLARAAAVLRRLPSFAAADERVRWQGEICRAEVLKACDRYLAELEAEYQAVEGRLEAAKSVRGPDCTGCETREDYDAAFAAWDASLTGEEVERMEAEGTEQIRAVQPYFDRFRSSEEAVLDLAEVVEAEYWITRRAWTAKQVLDCILEPDGISG